MSSVTMTDFYCQYNLKFYDLNQEKMTIRMPNKSIESTGHNILLNFYYEK